MRFVCAACGLTAEVHVAVNPSIGVRAQLAMARCPRCRRRDLRPLRKIALRDALVVAAVPLVAAIVHFFVAPGQALALFPAYALCLAIGEAVVALAVLRRRRHDAHDVTFDDIELEDARDSDA